MLIVVGSAANHLRVEGDPTSLTAPRAPDGVRLHVRAATTRLEATCPACSTRASRVHSTYRRTLADLALQGVPVDVEVAVRRFRCDNPACPRGTFVESLGDFAAPRAQRTQRLAAMQARVGLALGGAAGSRLLPALGAPSSPSTVLRLVRRAEVTKAPTPRVLGVDDWALKRGHTYGTLLIDQERRRPIALLPDREAATFAQWLAEHPGVEVITRDRAEAYAEGATRGAPAAVQIADRWHLLKNASDALERVLQRHRGPLAESAAAVLQPAAPTQPEEPPAATPASNEPAAPRQPTAAQARRAAWQALYGEIQQLRAEGASIEAISGRLGVSRPTVRKYLRAPSCPERAPRRTKIGTLSTFDTHLRTRWAAGCRDASVLWTELKALGFLGSLRSVQRHVAGWPMRDEVARERRTRRSKPTTNCAPAVKSPSPSLARWWLILPTERLSNDQRRFVDHLLAQSEDLRAARDLATDFGGVIRARDSAGLATWLQKAAISTHAEFRAFAASLRRDIAAVEAAVREPWSNGQTEGQVNKLKLVKRQTYGRAKLDLLERRLLAA